MIFGTVEVVRHAMKLKMEGKCNILKMKRTYFNLSVWTQDVYLKNDYNKIHPITYKKFNVLQTLNTSIMNIIKREYINIKMMKNSKTKINHM